jgi:hypothetical protein
MRAEENEDEISDDLNSGSLNEEEIETIRKKRKLEREKCRRIELIEGLKNVGILLCLYKIFINFHILFSLKIQLI